MCQVNNEECDPNQGPELKTLKVIEADPIKDNSYVDPSILDEGPGHPNASMLRNQSCILQEEPIRELKFNDTAGSKMVMGMQSKT